MKLKLNGKIIQEFESEKDSYKQWGEELVNFEILRLTKVINDISFKIRELIEVRQEKLSST